MVHAGSCWFMYIVAANLRLSVGAISRIQHFIDSTEPRSVTMESL